MLNRDFTKSNKDYFAKNKITLISVAVFLVLGIVLAIIFGFNANFEINGYYEFSVDVAHDYNYAEYTKTINDVVNKYGADCDTISIFDEGDNTQLVVRYLKPVSNENIAKIEADLVSELKIEAETISDHIFVKPIVKATDYVYTATAVLIVLAVASLFAYFRYNGASAITLILTCALGTLGFVCLGAILRLSIGLSYFAMIAILNLLLIYFAFDLFENMRNENWLSSKDYSQALNSAIKSSKTSQLFISAAIMVIGVLLVIFATSPIKYVALNVMFMSVVALACAWYVIPFIWSVFITKCKIKEYKVKATKVEDIIEDK